MASLLQDQFDRRGGPRLGRFSSYAAGEGASSPALADSGQGQPLNTSTAQLTLRHALGRRGRSLVRAGPLTTGNDGRLCPPIPLTKPPYRCVV